jgi:hypothetical protein
LAVIKKRSLLEYVEIFVEGSPELDLIDFCLALHPVLYTVLSLGSLVFYVKSLQAFGAVSLGIVLDDVIVDFFGPAMRLSWLEVHCSDLTFPKAPVLDWRYFMKRGSKGLFETVGFIEV